MAALITVYSQPATYQAAQLKTYSDMGDTLNYLQSLGYTGQIQLNDGGVWLMWFQSTAQNATWTAKIGDWVVVKNNAIASSVAAAQAANLYTTTPPA